MTTTRTRRVATLALAAGLLATAVPAASAKDGEVRRSGTCTLGASWKLKAAPENASIKVEAEVDSNVVGQTWSVALRDNGVLIFSGSRVTTAPSGSFSVARITANRAGDDVITLRATNAATGEVCSGRVTYTG